MDLKPEWRGWFPGNPPLLTLSPLLLPGTPGAQGGPEGVTLAVASALSAGETVRGCLSILSGRPYGLISRARGSFWNCRPASAPHCPSDRLGRMGAC